MYAQIAGKNLGDEAKEKGQKKTQRKGENFFHLLCGKDVYISKHHGVNAVEHLPNVAMFHYNLACYECQLGNLDDAKIRLKRAIELDTKFRLMALEDEDLAGLWGSTGGEDLR